MDVASFLEGVDDNIVHRELRQVPEVANHLNKQVALRVHDVKKWLFSSAIAGVLGLTLFVAGYKQLLFSDWQYSYESHGVVHPDEPNDALRHVSIVAGREDTRRRDHRRSSRQAQRRDQVSHAGGLPDHYESTVATHFIEQVPGGSRIYQLKNSSFQARAENRYLMLAGVLLAFASLFGFIVEMRLRQLKK